MIPGRIIVSNILGWWIWTITLKPWIPILLLFESWRILFIVVWKDCCRLKQQDWFFVNLASINYDWFDYWWSIDERLEIRYRESWDVNIQVILEIYFDGWRIEQCYLQMRHQYYNSLPSFCIIRFYYILIIVDEKRHNDHWSRYITEGKANEEDIENQR